MSAVVTLVDEATRAHVALSPLRLRILRQLAEPGSATEVAQRLEESRQKVNYHMGVLHRYGLIDMVEERRRRGFIEKRFQRRGSVVLAPDLVDSHPADRDAMSADAVVASASDVIRSVGTMSAEAAGAGRRLVTATLTTDVTFGSPADLRAFLDGVAELAAGFDRGGSDDGQRMRITLLSHPVRSNQRGDARD